MRPLNPFILSVGIHVILVALFVGAISSVQKTVLAKPEKIALKILQHPSASEAVAPAPRPSENLPKPAEPILVPAPKHPVTPILPAKKVTEANKATVSPIAPLPATPPLAVAVPKAPDAVPAAAPKAPSPPPQKGEENYEEENLGRIRSILAERLKYPKNALRLKQQGESTVAFTLGTNREVSQITVVESSGFELLDDAAKNLIESSAAEFPKPKKAVRISVPIAYKLR